MANEEALERGYQIAPDPSLRRQFTATAVGLVSLLRQIRAAGTPADRAVATSVLGEHARYLVLAYQLFAQVDAGDVARTVALEEEALPRVHMIESLIYDVAARHARSSEPRSTVRLRAVASGVVVKMTS